MQYTKTDTHITDIRSGDTILHYGVLKTVCKCNIKYNSGVGITLFGDSYNLGYKAVAKITDLKY